MYCKIGFSKISKENKNTDKKIITLWRNMLNRCYNPNFDKYRFYGERGVRVSERWLNINNFIKDIQKLENYDKWLISSEYSLDKDLKGHGKIYSKETCLFLEKDKQNKIHKKVKPIKAITNSETIYFNSLREAELHFNIHRALIRKYILKDTQINNISFQYC